MGNSNAFDYNVYTEWAPGFVSLLLYMFNFVNMNLFVVSEKCCHPCVESVCTLKAACERWETHAVNQTESHNVSKQYGVGVTHSTVQYVLGIACLCCCTITLLTPLKIWKTRTENVNTTKKRECYFSMDEIIANLLVYIESFTFCQAHAAQLQLLFKSRLQRM